MAIKIKRDDDTSINLTPMIDIVFLLIIFFMVGSRFSELTEAERNLPLKVPQVTDARTLTAVPSKRVINVLEDGQVLLDREKVTLEQLYEELADARQQYKQTGVIVRGDADSPYQNVADVIAICRKADVLDLNISVRVAQGNSQVR